MLELKNITKIYNQGDISETCLFNNFNLNISKGEFLSIVGSNGSGKTSLLNIICGNLPIENGKVLINNKNITKMKDYQRYSTIGRVYQNPSMGTCPNLTMLENMSLADNKGKPFNLSFGINKSKENYYKDQLSILGLGLENKMDIKVGSLSGGQRQAVALIMSTLTPIEFLILDEHTAALDPKTAEIIMEITGKVIKQKNLTAMMVTHNLRHAVEYGNHLIMMDKGKIVLNKNQVEKSNLKVNDILDVFTSISIECGN